VSKPADLDGGVWEGEKVGPFFGAASWTLVPGPGYTCGMSHAIPAIYDAGVFRPLEPVDWPEGTRAEVIPLSPTASSGPPAAATLATWPPEYFERTAGALADENFERPPQGELPQREDW
jgi:hypothetical protein